MSMNDAKQKPDAEADFNHAFQLLSDLALALDGAFISSWQPTAGWDVQLQAALQYISTVENAERGRN